MTAPASASLSGPQAHDLLKLKSRIARKFRLRSLWYIVLKWTAVFYALILSNLRLICSPRTDWVFHIINCFVLLFLVVDFCLLVSTKKTYLFSLASFAYFLATLFTFFDFGIFTIAGFQTIEFTIYLKLLFLIDPMFFERGFLSTFFAGVGSYVKGVCCSSRAKSKKPKFQGIVSELSKKNVEEAQANKIRKHFIKDSVRVAQASPPAMDSLIYEKQQIFSDLYCREHVPQIGGMFRGMGTPILLDRRARTSEQVIRDQVRLKLIVWQIIICLVLLCYYKNWVYYTSGYSAMHSVIAFQIRDTCDASQNVQKITDLLKNNDFENTRFLTATLWRSTPHSIADQQLQVFMGKDVQEIKEISREFRDYELMEIDSRDHVFVRLSGQCYLTSVLNNRRYYQMVALMNILRAIVVFVFINIYFQVFVERMVRKSSKVFNVGVDFCRIMKMNISEGGKLAWEHYNELRQEAKKLRKKTKTFGQVQINKTDNAVVSANWKVIQTAAFLKAGFGDAGINFLRSFLADERNNNATEVDCVISFIEIREFDSIVEKMEEAIVDFLSEVAEIISKNIDRSKGFSNKNSEAYFLLMWKCQPGSEQKTAENAFYSIVDALHDVEIKSHGLTIEEFRTKKRFPGSDFDPEATPENPSIIYQSHGGRTPLNIKIGAGLHYGRVTEGGVGSQYKIDISYISKEVNMASRVQSVTKQFGLRLLMSNRFRNLLGPDYFTCLRPVDRVYLKGSAEQVELYTYDGILHGFLAPGGHHKWLRVDLDNEGAKCENLVNCLDPDYQQFLDYWKDGYDLYLRGQFEAAAPILTICDQRCLQYGDKSAQTLLRFMESLTPEKRLKWDGARKLENK